VTQPALFAVEDGEHSAVTQDGAIYCPGPADRAERRILGDASEFEFCKQAVMRGWQVRHNGGWEPDYDVIVKKPRQPILTVQIKRAWRSNPVRSEGSYTVFCRKSGEKNASYSLNAFHVLAAHLTDIDAWLFFGRHELGDCRSASYTLPQHRKKKRSARKYADRIHDNWELLDQVAAMYSQESFTPKTANVPHPNP
jgi:hypothetical protein